MAGDRRRASPPAAIVAAAIALAACQPAPSASPAKLAYCTQLYMLWFRYEQHATFHHTGQRARAELALDDCEHGRYDRGVEVLRGLLLPAGHRWPPAP